MGVLLQNQRRAFTVFLVSLILLFAFILKPFWISFVLGMVLVILFYPLYQFFLKLFRNYRYPASFFATFAVVALLLVPGAVITSLVVNQLFNGVIDQAVNFIDTGRLTALLQKWNVNLDHYIALLDQTFHVQLNLKGMAGNTIKQSALTVYQYSPAVLIQTVTFLFQSFLTLVVVFFLFVEGRNLYEEFVLISPLKDAHEHALGLEIRSMIYSVVYGSFVTALVQAFLAGVAFYFLDVQGYLVWAFLTFFFSFVPMIGATAVWLPTAIIFLLSGETRSGVFLMIYGALISSGIDNILKPLLIGSKNSLHPVLLFLSIMGGIRWIGPIGILLGPIIAAVLLAALKIYKQDYLDSTTKA